MTLFTSQKMAEYLDVSERRVRQMRDEEIIKEARPGLYDPAATMKRYIRYIHSNGSGLNEERARLISVKRERAELELAEAKGGLHRTEDIEKALSTMVVNFRARMLAIPAKLAGDLAKMNGQAEVFDVLNKEITEALEELSDYNKAFAAEENDGEAEE